MADLDKFCSLCGKDVVHEKHIRDRDGELCCLPCHETKRRVQTQQREKAAAGPASPAAPVPVLQVPVSALSNVPEPEPSADAEAPQDETWGWTRAILILALSLAVMTGLHMKMPKADAINLTQAFGAGAIQTLFVAVGAILLMISMALAFRITGGSAPGSIEKVFTKALGLVLAVSIVDFFTDRNETLWMMLYGFRGLLLLISLIVLFDLEFFDTMILSSINMIVGWVLAFGLAAALAAGVSISHTPSHSYEIPTQQAMPGDPDLDVHWDK